MKFTYQIYLHSPLRKAYGRKDQYAPSAWPTFTASSKGEAQDKAREFARENIKLDENLHGKQAFEVRICR